MAAIEAAGGKVVALRVRHLSDRVFDRVVMFLAMERRWSAVAEADRRACRLTNLPAPLAQREKSRHGLRTPSVSLFSDGCPRNKVPSSADPR
jgi:hypothetical protein